MFESGSAVTHDVERFGPQSKTGQARFRMSFAISGEANNANIVCDYPMAVVAEGGCKRRFAGSRFSHEGYRCAADIDGIRVQREKAALMQKGTESRPEQIESNISVRGAHLRVDGNRTAVSDSVLGHSRDHEN
jgi:hypothetical protein